MLTDTAIKQVRPSNKTQKLFDGYRTGLHLLVHPGGRKTFAIKYPHPITKKERTFTIGPYPHITLKEARAETEKARTLLVHGIDPQEDKVKRKAEIKAAHVDTFEQIAHDWIKFRGARWSEKYRHKVRTTLARHLMPALGKTPITKITAKFLLSLLRPIENSGKTDFELILDNNQITTDNTPTVLRMSNISTLNVDNTAQTIELQFYLKDNDLWRSKIAVGFLLGTYTSGGNKYSDGLMTVSIPANTTGSARQDAILVEYYKGSDSFIHEIPVLQDA